MIEYIETGTMMVIYAIIGLIVAWLIAAAPAAALGYRKMEYRTYHGVKQMNPDVVFSMVIWGMILAALLAAAVGYIGVEIIGL